MTIESLPANIAASSATVAQSTAIQATDGAQVHTDALTADQTAFAAIFQQLSQTVAPDAPAAQPTLPNAPTLPSLPAIPPPAIAAEQLASQPVAAPKHAQALASDISPPEEPLEVEKDSLPDEKPQKQSAARCDTAEIPAALPAQPLDIKLPSQSQEQPIVQDDVPKTKPTRPEKISPPKAQESDDPALKSPKKSDPIESIRIPQELTDDATPPAKDVPPVPDHPKLDAPKTEFTLSPPHLAQKIDAPTPPPLTPEQSFIQNNHPQILTAIHGQLLPNGGSMHIRLDPPELGALAVQIDVRDGIVNASFQTSNEEATRLLSHSLTQLRTTLESAGVSVEKLQVQQAPREHFSSNNDDRERNPRQQAYEHSAQDDRQRREMLQRMWRRLTVGRDMLDLVA